MTLIFENVTKSFKIKNRITIHYRKEWFRKEMLIGAKLKRNLGKEQDTRVILYCSLTDS